MSICVALSMAFYVFITKVSSNIIIADKVDEYLMIFIAIVLSTVVFSLVYSILYSFYIKYLEHRVTQKENIYGDWFYLLEINGKPNDPRYGICRIEKHDGEMYLSGIHYSPQTKTFTSMFSTDSAIINKDKIVVNYSSTGADEDVFNRKGVYYLNTEGIPPQRIFGIWSDVLEGSNKGRITMHKRTKETDSLLKEIGYPFEKAAQLRTIFKLQN